MSKPRGAAPAAHPADALDPARWLLSFLDRNLARFSKGVRNVIALTLLDMLSP